MKSGNKYKQYTGLILALAFSSSASAIDIQSYSGSLTETPAGTPIFANGNDGQPLQKYNPDSSVNHYVWVDKLNNVLSQSLIFTPKSTHIGSEVKLCQVNNDQMNCSNELEVINSKMISSGNDRNRALRSITPFESVWSYSSQFDDDILLISTASFSTTTHFTYSGQQTSGPLPIGLIPRITDQDGNALVSLHVPMNPTYSDFDFTFIANVNLGAGTQIVNFCPDLLVTDTFPPTLSSDSKCISKLLRDGDIESNNSNYFYPPSPAQFDALFPNVNFTQTETVTFNGESKNFVSAPRIDDSGVNLLDSYCRAIGENIVPLDQNEMEAFANSSDFVPGNFWPGTTGYWTNQNDNTHPWATLIPGGMGVVGGLTLPSGTPEFASGSNSYYRGFYICKKL